MTRILLLDVETCPVGWREVAAAGPPWTPPAWVLARAADEFATRAAKATTKAQRERVEAQRAEVAADALKWWRDGALEPDRAEVVAVALHDWSGGGGGSAFVGVSESHLIGILATELDLRQPEIIVAHGGSTFDFPLLWERGLRTGQQEVSRWFSGVIPWADQRKLGVNPPAALIDTLSVWRPGPRIKGAGLVALHDSIHPPQPDPITGAGVLDALLLGREQDVIAHVLADVRRLDRIWTRLADGLGLVG